MSKKEEGDTSPYTNTNGHKPTILELFSKYELGELLAMATINTVSWQLVSSLYQRSRAAEKTIHRSIPTLLERETTGQRAWQYYWYEYISTTPPPPPPGYVCHFSCQYHTCETLRRGHLAFSPSHRRLHRCRLRNPSRGSQRT